MPWPLVARAPELERIERLRRAGRGGVVLAGPAGIGKTRLGTEALMAASNDGFAVLHVAATAGGAAVPFGPFASLLPDLAPGTELPEMLRQVSEAIIARGAGKPVALFLDDANFLDERSTALTRQLIGGRDVFVIATVRSDDSSETVAALWQDGLAERLELGPLSPAEANTLLVFALGGTVDGAAAHQFWERSGGNPLFLRELVCGAVEEGAFRNDRGVWRLVGPLPTSDRLTELVESRLIGLSPPDVEVLEVLAVGEPLGVRLHSTLGDPSRMDTLERRGLVAVLDEGRRRQARLAHQLYGDVLRRRLSPVRAKEAARTLAGATESTGARRRDDVLRVAFWRLEGGGDIDGNLMLAAAKQAYARHDLGAAERLADAARSAGAGFGAGLLLGTVLSQTGNGEEAEKTLRDLVSEANSDEDRAVLAVARIENLTALGRIADVMAVAETAETAIVDPAARAEVAVWRAFVFWLTGEVAKARALAEPLLSQADGRAFISACAVAAYMFGTAGRLTDALETTARGYSAHVGWTGPPLRWTPHIHLHLRCDALILAGRLSEAENTAADGYDKAVARGDSVGQGWLSWALAMSHLAQGHLATAARWGHIAAELCREEGHVIQLGYVLVCLAHALALAGKTDDAAAVLAEYAGLPGSGGQERRSEFLAARAWLAVARGNQMEAVRDLQEAAGVARAQGSLAQETAALHDLARLGNAAAVTPRLAELARVVEGPLAPARAGHAAALSSGDGEGLDAASLTFEHIGADLLAAEAAADAAAIWRHAGQEVPAAASHRRAVDLAARCEGARTPALDQLVTRSGRRSRWASPRRRRQ